MALNGWLRAGASAVLPLVLMRFAVSQWLNEPSSPPTVALTQTASASKAEGLPQTITIELKNVSDRSLIIPEPHKDCGDGMYGSLFLRISFLSDDGPPTLASGCVADYSFSNASIWDRIKAWKRLAPGESLVYTWDVMSKTLAEIRTPLRKGQYTYTAIYVPPSLSDGDKGLLNNAGLYPVHEQLEARPLSFTAVPTPPPPPQTPATQPSSAPNGSLATHPAPASSPPERSPQSTSAPDYLAAH